MTQIQQHPLPYQQDCSSLFAAFRDEPWAMWLDSCATGGELGRYDIFVARPHTTLVTQGCQTEVCRGKHSEFSPEDPFALIAKYLVADCLELDTALPFVGGALGYFAYDLARRIEILPNNAEDDLQLPEMVVGIYDWAVVCDHHLQQCQLVSSFQFSETEAQWPELIAILEQALTEPPQFEAEALISKSDVESNMSEAGYRECFDKIQHYLKEGDCYQVNFAQRFSARVSGSPWSGYMTLRQTNPAPFSAYLNTPYGQILSSSPERFLKVEHGHVETRPIKGTRPRSADPIQDQRMVDELADSTKDRAENLMIVDLLRNDLGKCCRPGTIRVPQLFAVEHYATVHHLVSVVEGELTQNESALSLLRHCFPGGSITGAPKLRAMEIIEELEPHRRGVYCGAIGYIGFDGNMDTNIAIRTAVHQNGRFTFSAGGGIVRDSQCESEYQECFDKAAGLMRIFSS